MGVSVEASMGGELAVAVAVVGVVGVSVVGGVWDGVVGCCRCRRVARRKESFCCA